MNQCRTELVIAQHRPVQQRKHERLHSGLDPSLQYMLQIAILLYQQLFCLWPSNLQLMHLQFASEVRHIDCVRLRVLTSTSTSSRFTVILSLCFKAGLSKNPFRKISSIFPLEYAWPSAN